MTVSLAFTLQGGNDYSISGSKTVILSNEGGVDNLIEGYIKDLKIRSLGKGSSKATEQPVTYLFDWKQGVQSYTITGHLYDTSGGDTAKTKKNILIAMAQEGQPEKTLITFTWSDGFTGTKNVAISRLSFRQISGTPVYFAYDMELVYGKAGGT